MTEQLISANEVLACTVLAGCLPDDPTNLIRPLMSEDRQRFAAHESYLFDYKRSWFRTLKDEGAPNILRAIAAFHNTHGGILFVGVDNETRLPGRNTIPVDIEHLNTIIRDNFSRRFSCEHRRYELPNGALDCILIPKRPLGERPLRINTKMGIYPAGVVWKRENHEVLRADAEDTVMLHGPRDYGSEASPGFDSVNVMIPPDKATIQRFIGREDALDDLFDWLGKPRSPRAFLWGRGGSGKSTIAYELAVATSLIGGDLRLSRRDPLQTVIFLSAKLHELDTLDARVAKIASPDFTNRRELFEALLCIMGEEEAGGDLTQLSDDQLVAALERAFDTRAAFIVIDDIDTISTSEDSETGAEDLFYILSRSKLNSKILYTQRDRPRFGGVDTIEVKPLNESEYQAFIDACCKQFKVPTPPSEFISVELAATSERRPLIIEVIIGLARTCAGDFYKALELYNNRSGQDARRYLFEREYLHLASEVDARTVLYAIALFNAPMTFDDLQVVTRWEADRVRDAIQPVLDMFLEQEEEKGQSRITMSVPAREYILEVSQDLPRRELIANNIDSHKAARHAKGSAIAALEAAVNNLLRSDLADAAWQRVTSFSGNLKEMNSPHFKVIRTIANAHRATPDLSLAREDMNYAIDMRCASVQSLLIWMSLEARAQLDLSAINKITRYAESEKSIRQHEKAEIFVRRAKLSLDRAYHLRDVNQTTASQAYIDAIAYNLRAQTIYQRLRSPKRGINHEMVARSTWHYLSFIRFHRLWDAVPEHLRSLHNPDVCLFADSFVEPWLQLLDEWRTGDRRVPFQTGVDVLQALDQFILNPRRCYFEAETREDAIRESIRTCRNALRRLQRAN